MNLSQVKLLKDSETVVFKYQFWPFTVGKQYEVRDTPVGIYVYDDNGMGHPISSNICFEHHFKSTTDGG